MRSVLALVVVLVVVLVLGALTQLASLCSALQNLALALEVEGE
jgi:hypothetical protein